MNITIGTHNGVFHCDEVVASAVISIMHDQDDITIIRTRDTDILNDCTFVLDVGGVFNAPNGRFDHHMKNGGMEPRENGISYATAGMIWYYYGGKLIQKLYPEFGDYDAELVLRAVDVKFMQGIDANDNGQDIGKPNIPVQTISSLISSMNPTFVESRTQDECFHEAVKIAKVFVKRVIAQNIAQFKAREVLISKIASCEDGILILNTFLPWPGVLQQYDPDHKKVKLVVFNDLVQGWMVQSPNVTLGSFDLVTPLPKEWRGKRDEELNAIIGIPDAIFCHRSGFIAGAHSKESALKMAHLAMK